MIRCVTRRISTGAIENERYQIHEDFAAAGPAGLGLEAGLEVLIPHEPNPKPEPGGRYYRVDVSRSGTENAHPSYPAYKTYETTYSVVKRPIEEIEDGAYEAERSALERIFTEREQIKLLTLGLAVAFREVSGTALSQKEQTVKTRCLALAVKVWKNDANVRSLIQQAQAGDEPDQSTGWEA